MSSPRTITTSWTAEAAVAARLEHPRDDVVTERPADDRGHRFTLAGGPFLHYERRVLPQGDGTVREEIDHQLPPLVVPPFTWLYRAALRRRTRHGGRPFWAPPEPPDATAANALGGLCLLAIVFGYLGSLLTQTITFAADELDADKAAQGATLAGVRIGVLLAVALAALADRRGRRRLLLATAAAACLATAVTALVPGMLALGAIQTLVRALTTAGAVLLAVTVAEEMPAGSRAYGVSLLSMAGALGVGTALWALPLADTGEAGWRLLYGLGLLWLPLVAFVGRHLAESRRFQAVHADAPMVGHGRRFWLLAVSALLLNLFTAPATQLMNEFLRDERGFSAARISLFTILTNTPGGIGILVGGRLADVRGRRLVGAVGVLGGTMMTVAMVLAAGWPMWTFSVVGAVVGAATVPALGVYGPELFPTSLRGRANGVISVLGVAGGVIGLLAAGYLSDRWDGLGPALGVLSLGPLLMALLVLTAYPETAHRELEELNPEDRSPPPEASPSMPAGRGPSVD
ncbi:MAG: MFS transporter [Actinomycetota bacterium]